MEPQQMYLFCLNFKTLVVSPKFWNVWDLQINVATLIYLNFFLDIIFVVL